MRFPARATTTMVTLLLASLGHSTPASGQAGTPYLRYEVRGRVLEEGNVHVGAKGVLVIAAEIGDSTTTDSAGRFVLRGVVLPGCFRVTFVSPLYSPAEAAVDLRRAAAVTFGPVVLRRRTSGSAVYHYGSCWPAPWDWPVAYGAVDGRVTTRNGLPMPSEPVATECPALDTARTDDAGHYRLDLVVPYSRRRLVTDTAFLSCRVWLPESGDTAVANVRFAPTPLAFAPTVVSFGASEIVAPYDAAVSGRVVDGTDASPVEGALVEIPELNVRTSVDARGRFALRFAAPAGCYRLSARYIGYAPVLRHLLISRSQSLPQGVIRLQRRPFGLSGQAVQGDSGCTFTLRAWPWRHPAAYGEVIGRVTWADSEPFAFASVMLGCGNPSGGEANASGFFRIDVSFGGDWEDSLAHRRWVTCRLVDASIPTNETQVTIPLAASPIEVKAVAQLLVRPRSPARR